MREIKTAVSKQEPTDLIVKEEEGVIIDWKEQKKLLRKCQVAAFNKNEEMMRLVKDIEENERIHQTVLVECENDEERLKIRKKFIEVKTQNQKDVKKTMSRHKKEAENLDKQELNAKLKASKLKKEGEEEEAAGDGEEEQNNEGDEEVEA